MKKAVFTVLALFMLTSTAFAECRSLSLGFVTIISGEEWVSNWVWEEVDGTFKQVDRGSMQPCSAGNRWQWFWE
jgi:hypothetical protein